RFSMTGHRLLFQKFQEEKSGMVAGPGTVLVWSLIGFAKGMFASPRLSQLAGLLARGLFFWLKYFDYCMRNNALALDVASCTYFYGKKTDHIVPLAETIRRYEGSNIQHV
ncbi:MAG: methyltransferase, partial [Deltaproteobacteria bacterium]|nr:methyltransferase [Deltaproteobacteria bacterium]